jgi:hypothetical protein
MDYLGHLRTSLDGCDLGRFPCGRIETWIQLAGSCEYRGGLSQGGQHLAYVMEEDPVGPHDEHTAAAKSLAMRVKQVRRAM